MLPGLICRSFDARRECSVRKYSYLLPLDVIGVKDYFTAGEIDHHLSDFNDILNTFEVRLVHMRARPFHFFFRCFVVLYYDLPSDALMQSIH